MVFPESLNIPDETMLPCGFMSRGYRDNDRGNWLNLMIENGQLGRWNRDRVQHILLGQSTYSGQQFVLFRDKLVACAGAYLKSQNGTKSWEIGWIATDPNFFGKGLASHVIIRAIRHTRFYNPYPIFLLTDDFRTPAISLYLKSGFSPSSLNETDIVSRWKRIESRLEEPEAAMLRNYIENRNY